MKTNQPDSRKPWELPQPTKPLEIEDGDLTGQTGSEWVIPALVCGAWVVIVLAVAIFTGHVPDLSPIADLFGRAN